MLYLKNERIIMKKITKLTNMIHTLHFKKRLEDEYLASCLCCGI
jgi:hypothetical protein